MGCIEQITETEFNKVNKDFKATTTDKIVYVANIAIGVGFGIAIGIYTASKIDNGFQSKIFGAGMGLYFGLVSGIASAQDTYGL